MIKDVDAIVIGTGSAGMAAAIAMKEAGIGSVLVVDREEQAGGVLLQCIHNGFGLHRFGEELTGPEYAQRDIDLLAKYGIESLFNTSAVDIIDHGEKKKVMLLSQETGFVEVVARAVVLAMGCRERNRGNISIPGSRPAGIMTAGLAQRFVNIEGYMPGKEVVIIGSGDIGLIMARRMTLEGASVKAVVEIQAYPGGLNRNIVQCLNDFNIPLYLSHAVTNVLGSKRVEAVQISPLKLPNGNGGGKEFTIQCDTLLLSVGLIPENELSINAGINIHSVTGGPIVNSCYMTSRKGIFACGNVLHVHDLVDYVSQEASACGRYAAQYLQGTIGAEPNITVNTGNLVRYALPSKIAAGKESVILLRPIAPASNVMLKVMAGDKVIYSKKFVRVMPSEMIQVVLPGQDNNCNSVVIGFEAA